MKKHLFILLALFVALITFSNAHAQITKPREYSLRLEVSANAACVTIHVAEGFAPKNYLELAKKFVSERFGKTAEFSEKLSGEVLVFEGEDSEVPIRFDVWDLREHKPRLTIR